MEVLRQASENAGNKILDAVARIAPITARVVETRAEKRGQIGFRQVVAALILVVVASVAVLVVDKFDGAVGNDVQSSSLSSSQDSILSGFADMAELIGPLLLVAIAIVIIGLVRRVQSQ